MTGRTGSPAGAEAPKLRGFDDFQVRLGDLMRGERATIGKSLLDVQRDLKIKAAYIAAIENCDPSAFETQGFVAGYVRSYARYLGMDPEETFQAFCAESGFATAHGMSSQASTKTQPPKPLTVKGIGDPLLNPAAPYRPQAAGFLSEIEPRAIASVAVLLALIGGIGYGAWSVLQEIQRVGVAPVQQAPGVASTVNTIDPIAGLRDMTQGPEVAVDSTPANPPALDRLYRPRALDVPVMEARDGPIGAVDPSKVGSLVPYASPPAVDTAAPEAPPVKLAAAPAPAQDVQVVAAAPPQVVVFAVRPAWVRVQAADGTVLFEKILDPGERYTVPAAQEPARLRAGNSGSVYLAVGDKTYGPVGNSASVAKNVALGPDEVRSAYSVADLNSDPALKKFATVAQADTKSQ
jgi:hypothetical protein